MEEPEKSATVSSEISFIGGSRIGAVNATIPFSRLTVGNEKLTLKTSFFKTLEFGPEDLVRIEEVYYVPIIAQGIRIVHRNPGYKSLVIFWSLKDPQKILQEIEKRNLIHSGN